MFIEKQISILFECNQITLCFQDDVNDDDEEL